MINPPKQYHHPGHASGVDGPRPSRGAINKLKTKDMTLREAINEFKALAAIKGLEPVDISDDYTLRIEYRKNGRYVGGAS